MKLNGHAKGGGVGALLGLLSAGGLGYHVNTELADALEAKEESYKELVQQCIEKLHYERTGP